MNNPNLPQIVMVVLFAGLIITFLSFTPWGDQNHYNFDQNSGAVNPNVNPLGDWGTQLGQTMFGVYGAATMLISLLLLAAMLGAIYVAKEEPL